VLRHAPVATEAAVELFARTWRGARSRVLQARQLPLAYAGLPRDLT
jgi:hypothetical protein